MKLYQFNPSGNCYKVRLLAAQLGIPLERVEIKLRMTPEAAREFKKIHRLGRVPALELDDGTVMGESNAILWYLAEGTPYAPSDRMARARALEWMFWEQYDHEPTVAVARAWVSFFGVPPGGDLEDRRRKAYAALDVMERHLGAHSFFVEERYTIVDIALYAYTHVCHEGGMSLESYPAIRAWIERVRAQPGHVTIDA